MDALLLLFAVLVGGLLAVQAAANLQLSAAVASPVGASTLQLGIAAVLLTALAAAAGSLAAVDLLPQQSRGTCSAASAARCSSPPASCCSRDWARWSVSGCS